MKENNAAYIDGQNLYLGTKKSKDSWEVSYKKFRIYLKDKYKVKNAYYFIGVKEEKFVEMYKLIEKAGFTLKFRKHNTKSTSSKKGNVDVDIVYSILTDVLQYKNTNKVVLVSGDGDFARVVDFLIKNKKFKKLLLPSFKNYSSLYNHLRSNYRSFLEKPLIKKKIKK